MHILSFHSSPPPPKKNRSGGIYLEITALERYVRIFSSYYDRVEFFIGGRRVILLGMYL